MAEICVIGAGVSGLTTAIELSERGHRVTIFADATREGTTSSAAAAFWYPFWTGKEPDHSWYRPSWAWETFLKLERLVDQQDAGVSRAPLVEYFDSDIEPDKVQGTIESMWWRSMSRLKFKILSQEDVAGISCEERHFRSGTTFQTLVVNMSDYLLFLETFLTRFACSINQEHIERRGLDALCGKFDFVINCTGLGARQLVSDKSMTPVEGVVVHVNAIPEVQTIVLLHTGPVFRDFPVYIVPRAGKKADIVLGGTFGEDAEGLPRHVKWSSLPTETWEVQADAEMILRMCQTIEPRLEAAKRISISVGYRPGRKPVVRLEPEFAGSNAGRLIHNYGHGGGGVTLSWGCASEVSRWVEWLGS